jgi:predicted kinase
MPRLILLNGLPGSGKSVLGRRYAEDAPWTLVLDIDVVRALLSGWQRDPTQAGRLARGLALAMARTHLTGGRDVLVPQFLGRLDFVLAMADLAQDVDASFVEFALLVPPPVAAERFARRTAASVRPEHRDLAALLDWQGGLAALPGMHEQLLAVVAARPATRVVDLDEESLDEAYALLVAAAQG